MTAKELIENTEKLIKSYEALEKEYNQRSENIKKMTEKKDEKPESDRR